jgi:hypothetical protein
VTVDDGVRFYEGGPRGRLEAVEEVAYAVELAVVERGVEHEVVDRAVWHGQVRSDWGGERVQQPRARLVCRQLVELGGDAFKRRAVLSCALSVIAESAKPLRTIEILGPPPFPAGREAAPTVP